MFFFNFISILKYYFLLVWHHSKAQSIVSVVGVYITITIDEIVVIVGSCLLNIVMII
jgi:hypothetical protein